MLIKRMAAFVVVAGCGAFEARAAHPALDDFKDVCDYAVGSVQEAKLINATAMLIRSEYVHPSPDGLTYNVDTQSFDQLGEPMCMDSAFYDEVATMGGRTGVLIAPDMILTATHGNPIYPDNWKVVFRTSTATLGGPNCSDFTWTNIPKSNVYTPKHTMLVNFWDSSSPVGDKYDFGVFQLTQPVTGRAPVKIRRSGVQRAGSVAISPGYPLHAPEKISTASIFSHFKTTPYESGLYIGEPLYSNQLNGLEGSSGSAMWNVEDETIDVVVARPRNDPVFDDGADCWYVNDNGFLKGPNMPVIDKASQIPRAEVLVAPLDYIAHDVLLNSTPSTFTNHYTTTTARYSGQGNPIGGETVNLEKVLWPSGANDPNVSLSLPTGLYTVPAGGLPFDIVANISNVTACGSWDYELNVHDITNDQNNYIRHHFDIGLKEYSVDQPDDWIVDDVGPPYQASRTYTMTNVRDTPAHVMVSWDSTAPNSNLILINGSSNSSASYNLAPHATATVTLTLNQTVAAATTPGTEYHGRVEFYMQPFNCSTNPHDDYIKRDMFFTRGQQLVSATAAYVAGAPAGQPYGPATRFDIDMSGENAGTCVGDLNVFLGVPNPFNQGTLMVDQVAPKLRVQLTRPNGLTSRVLWLSNAIPVGSPSPYISAIGSPSVPALFLDDQSAPPLGGTMLNFFNNVQMSGHWYVDVSTSLPGGLLMGPVGLDFATAASCLH